MSTVTKYQQLSTNDDDDKPKPDFNAQLLKVLQKPTSSTEPIPFDEARFNKLYDELIEQNDRLRIPKSTFSFGKQPSILIKPTDLKMKTSLYNLLDMIDKSGSPQENTDPSKKAEQDKAALLLKKNLAVAFFLTLKSIQLDKIQVQTVNSDNPDAVANTLTPKLLLTFIGDLYKTNNEYAMRFFPFIQTLREYVKGYHSTSFNDKITAEDVIRKQIQEAKDGIKNEFSILSMFVGTRSQKIAAQTTFIAAVGSGLWALVAFLEKNPTTSAMLAGTIAAAGSGGVSVVAIIGAAAVSYYVLRTIQDRYAKYFILIRVMNEYMIVLNKIQRLALLSLSISKQYYFDVNINEILSQLKILFTRFDEMLSNDDKSKIEKEVESMTTLPDIKEQAAQAQAGLESAATKDVTNAATNDATNDATNAATNGEVKPQTPPPAKNEPGFLDKWGAKIKQSTLTLTFDEVKWTKLLNDDIIKLNIYFTTAMTEFNMNLNVIQMGLLTSEDPNKKRILSDATTAISVSSEYRKMVIGILLNDILKLRVDFSYCNRGGGWFGFTKTNEELVCLENTGSDPVGNKRFLFKEKLHEHMIKLVNTLNSPKCPYDRSIKREIQLAVVAPYKKMLRDVVAPDIRFTEKKEDRFFLTQGAKFDDNSLVKGKTTVEDQVTDVKYGGGFFSKMKDIEPSEERNTKIIQDLQEKPYFLVPDNVFQTFLISVNKFVKEASKPTQEEQKEVGELTNAIRDNVKTALQPEGQPALPLIEKPAVTQSTTGSQTGQPAGSQSVAGTQPAAGSQTGSQTGPQTGQPAGSQSVAGPQSAAGQPAESKAANVGGSRRFTRKRVHGILVKKGIRRKTCVKKSRK